jgi:hypothetical protein
MAIYWIMYVMAALAAVWPARLRRSQARYVWVASAIAVSVIVGLRDEVGGDWFRYLGLFYDASGLHLTDVLGFKDPGFYAFGWIVAALGGDFHAFNLLCAIIMAAALFKFALRQSQPWLAIAVAIPYLVIVVFMGYSRQAVALSLCIFGLMGLEDGKVRRFIFWVCLATLFHKSAVLLFPVAALSVSRNRWLSVGIVGIAAALVYYLLVSDSSDELWAAYVDVSRQSEGGVTRILMNTLPALIFVAFRKKFDLSPPREKLWTWMSIFSLACLPMIAFSTTAADRIALYFIPVQIMVFSRLPCVGKLKIVRLPLVVGILGYYAAVQFVWLNYSSYAQFWVPYRSVIFGG